MLDSALLRAGRFDREIHVDLPGLNERKAIFLVHLKPIKIDETVDVDLLARQTLASRVLILQMYVTRLPSSLPATTRRRYASRISLMP